MEIKDDEIIEDLGYKNSKFIQNKNLYRFSSDSIILANLVEIKGSQYILDLGSGSGIIGILLALKNKEVKVDLIEIQEELYNLSIKNISINNLQDRVFSENANYISKTYQEHYDIIVINPPYFEKDKGMYTSNTSKALARTELKTTLKEIIETAKKAIKPKGAVYIIYKAERLVDLVSCLREKKLEPKKIYNIQPKANKEIDTIIIKAVRDGRKGIKAKNIVVYDENGDYTKKVKDLYSKD